MISPRKLMGVFAPSPEHWVGDGFFVRTVFHPQQDASVISPFLLLDFAEPKGARSMRGARSGKGSMALPYITPGKKSAKE
jgi:hypothetical protein